MKGLMTMTNKELANLIFPNITKTIQDYEVLYPERNVDGVVTRFAPSPTGFVHLGSLFASFVARKVATDTHGICFLRIEDTDQERLVENSVTEIIRDLKDFHIEFDEGMISETEETGAYGPYLQSKRKEIYQTFAKALIEEGKAYPCFYTKEELEEIREVQEASKERIGCYGKYAKYRDLPLEMVAEKIKNGEPYILRLKSPGHFDKKVVIQDLVRGKIEFPENDLDIVIIKKDGLPTYHFAHIVDDYLMRTTHVIRGDEWISSLPVHIQLFEVFGFTPPKYAHLSPLMKVDEETKNKRKLSKRKDPELAVSYYHEAGIPNEAVLRYLMTVANTNFEAWLDANPTLGIDDFQFDFKKVSASGGLFDLEKLYNISKNYISRLKASEVYARTLSYAKEFDLEFASILEKYPDYSIAIFNIEREQKKPRKDYSSWKDVKKEVWYFYDEYFHDVDYEYGKVNDPEEIKHIVTTYFENYYDESDDKEVWFHKIKLLSSELGYSPDMKEYKLNPDSYKGNVADISTVIRVSITSKAQTPDLYEILRLLGKKRILERLNYLK